MLAHKFWKKTKFEKNPDKNRFLKKKPVFIGFFQIFGFYSNPDALLVGEVMVEAEAVAMREYDSGDSSSEKLLAAVLVVGVMVAAAWWLKWRSQWQ